MNTTVSGRDKYVRLHFNINNKYYFPLYTLCADKIDLERYSHFTPAGNLHEKEQKNMTD